VIPLRLLTAALTAGCGLLAACGAPVSPSAAPTATPLSAGTFSTVIPPNWANKLSDATEVAKFSANGTVEFLIEEGPPGQARQNINDVTANINVLLLSSTVPDDQLAAYLTTVSNSGATNLSSPLPFTIDGATGQYITYDRDIQGTPGESRDMLISHGGRTYDIVLNTSQYAFAQQLAGLQAVLTAWRWMS
jgi:ABC-type glycerol-3-phosphate transport system substrate-binding protein